MNEREMAEIQATLKGLDRRLDDLVNATNHRVTRSETRIDGMLNYVTDRLDRFAMWFIGLAATGALSTLGLAATILLRT